MEFTSGLSFVVSAAAKAVSSEESVTARPAVLVTTVRTGWPTSMRASGSYREGTHV
jgi:hypothetical protein